MTAHPASPHELRASPAQGAHVAIVVARFNEPLTAGLLAGALAELERQRGTAEVVWVPGAFELPQAAAWLMQRDQRISAATQPTLDGILALGCLIKGDTDHYAVLAQESARRLGELATELAREGGPPLCFGVLTCQTYDQAEVRANPAKENKGGEVMTALLEMAELRRKLLSPNDR